MDLNGIGMTSQRTRERLVKRLQEQGIQNAQVLNAIRTIPRHIFVDEALSHRAYEDTALPIGHGQTISQPYIVARMTEALVESGPLNRVLEIGTGSGYQTAILAQFAGHVYSVERIKALQNKARERLQRLGIHNVSLRHSDGGMGWPSEGPFDAILAAAAPLDVPQELIEQLAVGGRLIIPVGGGEVQDLKLIVRTEEGVISQVLEKVRFVPFLRGAVQA